MGPVAFLCYLSYLYDVFEQHSVSVGGFADENQFWIEFNPSNENSAKKAISDIKKCIADIRSWMLSNDLKINDNKTEIILIGTQHQLSKLKVNHIKI